MADIVSQTEPASAESTLAKSLAPEDVRVGDYVTPLHEIREWPAFFWFCDSSFDQHQEMLRVRLLPENTGAPLKVQSVCLPFVLVKPAKGKAFTLDVRRSRLARISKSYARLARKSQKNKKKKRKSK